MVAKAAQQGRRRGDGGSRSGATSSAATARKNTSGRRQVAQTDASARCSPRLHLTKRTPVKAFRSKGRASNPDRNQRAKASGGRSTTGVKAGSRGGVRGSRPVTKNVSQVDGVAKIVKVLKADLAKAVGRAMGKMEAECEAMASSALDGCSAGVERRDEEQEAAVAAMEELELRHTSITSRCSGMLKDIESNRISLSTMVDRCRDALDGLQQAETRKLKSSLDRAVDIKS